MLADQYSPKTGLDVNLTIDNALKVNLGLSLWF